MFHRDLESNVAITYQIVSDVSPLRDCWEELWATSSRKTVFNSYAWTKATHDMHQSRNDAKLVCLIMRRDRRAVLIWPFLITHHHRWCMAIPVGTDQGSYSEVLSEDYDEDNQLRRAWRIVCKKIAADIIDLPGVREKSPLHRLLGSCRAAHILSREAAPYLRSRDFTSWGDYYDSRDRSLRKRVEGYERRLINQEGPVHVEVADNTEHALSLVNWLLDHKRDWLIKSHLQDETIMLASDYRQFLCTVVRVLHRDGRCLVQALKTDRHLLAVDVIFRSGRRSELFQATYNHEFAKFSPGLLARIHIIEREFRIGQEMDFLNGESASKQVWTDDTKVQIFHYRCAVSVFGKMYWLIRFVRMQLDRYRQMRHKIT